MFWSARQLQQLAGTDLADKAEEDRCGWEGYMCVWGGGGCKYQPKLNQNQRKRGGGG